MNEIKAKEWAYRAKNLVNGQTIQGKTSFSGPVDQDTVEMYVKNMLGGGHSRGRASTKKKTRYVNFVFTPTITEEEVNPVVIFIEAEDTTADKVVPFILTIKNEVTKETYCKIAVTDGKTDDDNELAAIKLAAMIKKARVVSL